MQKVTMERLYYRYVLTDFCYDADIYQSPLLKVFPTIDGAFCPRCIIAWPVIGSKQLT